jgi:hypothetical protein
VDDQRGGWPDDDDRLTKIEDELATLQDEITQLTQILPDRLRSDPRTPWDIWGSPDSTDEPPATSGRRGGIDSLRFPSDAIGGVEKQLTTLRWEVERLLRLVDLPPVARAGRPPRSRPRKSDAARRAHRDTVPEATGGAPPTGDQADGGAGDDALNRGLGPTKGPGGSGPWHEKEPEKVEPKKPFGF